MGGKRVSKASLRVAAYGEVDELNAALGVCLAHFNPSFKKRGVLLKKILHQLQQELFMIGADLSTPLELKIKIPRIKSAQTQQLEQWIDTMDAKLPALKNFILPGGGLLAAQLHLARTVCRRAERSIVSLARSEMVNENIIIYMNRLSDLLFVLARSANFLEDVPEEKWKN